MPLPVAHSLAGAAIYRGLDADGSWLGSRRVLLAIVLANAPDFDMIPGILMGEPNRFHQGPTHSLAFVAIAAAVAALGAAAGRVWPLRAGVARAVTGTAMIVAALWASHLMLDAFTTDLSEPVGIAALWPFSELRLSGIDWFPHVEKLSGQGGPIAFAASLFARNNLWAIFVELATMVPIVLLVSWRRARREDSK